MWNSLLKTITGAAGQAAQKVQQYIAPKPAPTPKVISQQQMMSNYSFAPAKPVNISSAINSGGLKVTSAPSTSPFQPTSSGGGTSYGTTSSNNGGSSWTMPTNNTSVSSIFRNSLGSLVPKAYASDGSTPTPTSTKLSAPSSTFSNVLSSLNPFSNVIKGLNTLGVKNTEGGVITPGSWLGAPEFKLTEKAGNYLSGLAKGYGVSNKDQNGSILGVSDGSSILAKRMADAAAKAQSTNNGTYSGGATANNSSYDALTAIDAETEKKLNDLQQQVVDGTIGQEEAAQRAKQIQDEANNLLYNQLIASQEGEIPLLNQEFDTAKTSLDNSIIQAAADAKAVKANNVNTVGETLRKISGNRDIAQKNINDVYTAAGTAGGSDYLKSITDVQRDAGNNIASGERDLQVQNAAIDRQQQSFENSVKDKVNQLVLERNKQLKTINDNINMSRTQKQAASLELNAKLATDLAGIRAYRDNAMNSFIQMKQQLALNTGELAKNGIINPSPYASNRYTPLDAGTDPSKQSVSSRAIKPIKQWGVNPKTGIYGSYLLDPQTGLKIFA